MKKFQYTFLALFILCATFLSALPAVAACNPGHESTGNQSFGGPNGRWEFVCDRVNESICCISHPGPVDS